MYVIAYDISDDKERNLVAKKIEDYGERVQKSVWICDISSSKLNILRKKLYDANITTGYIHIWLTQNEPYLIDQEKLAPTKNFAHFL